MSVPSVSSVSAYPYNVNYNNVSNPTFRGREAVQQSVFEEEQTQPKNNKRAKKVLGLIALSAAAVLTCVAYKKGGKTQTDILKRLGAGFSEMYKSVSDKVVGFWNKIVGKGNTNLPVVYEGTQSQAASNVPQMLTAPNEVVNVFPNTNIISKRTYQSGENTIIEKFLENGSLSKRITKYPNGSMEVSKFKYDELGKILNTQTVFQNAANIFCK